jgi:peptidoglycan/xylan/chitin deacetylase (PgdA/CDA1 family)
MILSTLSACGSSSRNSDPEPTAEPVDTPIPTPPPPTPTPTPEPLELVEFHGDIEHLFFHEAIAYPELAFPNRTDSNRLDDYMITIHEFNKVLENLYEKNYVLVNMHEVWSEFANESGQQRMRRNTLMIPEGKKPIILSFDDLTFHLEPKNAFMHRYIVGSDGEIWAEGIDPNGNAIITQDLTVITALDKFIKENPGFSHNGAKGCIAQTGLFGILGYHTQSDKQNNSDAFRLNRMKEIARVKPVIERLHETGWYFASHSWGHIRFDTASLGHVRDDAERWNDEVASLIGNTTIMIYAHGGRLDGQDVWRDNVGPAARHYIDELGFRMFASVGREPFTLIRRDVPAVMMDRMAVDGITLRHSRDRFLRFYDAKDVFDPHRPDLDVSWD